MGQKGMLPIVKCLAMALVLIAVGGCAYRDALVLENGEKVDGIELRGDGGKNGSLESRWVETDG